MKPKTAIIILIIIVMVVFGGMYFLYQYNKKQPRVKTPSEQSPLSGLEELTPTEQTIKLMQAAEKSHPSVIANPKEREKKIQETFDLMQTTEVKNTANQ